MIEQEDPLSSCTDNKCSPNEIKVKNKLNQNLSSSAQKCLNKIIEWTQKQPELLMNGGEVKLNKTELDKLSTQVNNSLRNKLI